MPAQKIDFKHIRSAASIADVLAYYDIELKKDGQKSGQFRGLCPFHEDGNPSLKVNTDRNIYHCFPCDAGGNVLEFVMEMDDIPIRDAAKRVAEICKISTAPGGAEAKPAKPAKGTKAKPKPAKKSAGKKVAKAQDEQDGIPYNKPLTFQLKNLQLDHPFIAKRGISDAARDEFGIGIATKGMMKDRLVFPLHNASGELVAYCGRFVGDNRPKDEPKYKQPPNFRKDLVLFNWHRVKELASQPVVMVESFFSAIKLHELGYRVVALMGRSLSEAQTALLRDADVSSVILLLDGDDPGRKAVIIIGRQLLDAGIDCSAPVASKDFKPHRASDEELNWLLCKYL